jgi:hypothetical protein
VRAAPAVSCAKCAQKHAHEHTGSAETLRHPPRNGFTAYAVLFPATNSSCHRRQRIDGFARPGWAHKDLRRLDTSNGCQNHTVLPYALAPFVLRAVVRSRKTALQTNLRADAATSTTSHPAFVTIAIRPSCRERTGRAGSADLPDGTSEIFFARGLDNPNHVEISAQIRFYAQRILRSFVIERRGMRIPCGHETREALYQIARLLPATDWMRSANVANATALNHASRSQAEMAGHPAEALEHSDRIAS